MLFEFANKQQCGGAIVKEHTTDLILLEICLQKVNRGV